MSKYIWYLGEKNALNLSLKWLSIRISSKRLKKPNLKNDFFSQTQEQIWQNTVSLSQVFLQKAKWKNIWYNDNLSRIEETLCFKYNWTIGSFWNFKLSANYVKSLGHEGFTNSVYFILGSKGLQGYYRIITNL